MFPPEAAVLPPGAFAPPGGVGAAAQPRSPWESGFAAAVGAFAGAEDAPGVCACMERARTVSPSYIFLVSYGSELRTWTSPDVAGAAAVVAVMLLCIYGWHVLPFPGARCCVPSTCVCEG